MPVRYGQSPWAAQLPKTSRPTYPKLIGRLDIPIVIVGGGLTGCATAYALAAAGHRVALVEAGQIASGATGQAAGLLLASPGADFLDLEKAHGLRVARALWQDTRRASLDAQATLRRLKIRCNLQPCDAIVAARTDEEATRLRRELTALKGAGLEATWLTGKALLQATGIDGVGGLRVARARLARSAPRGAGSRAGRGRARRGGVRSVAGAEDPRHA